MGLKTSTANFFKSFFLSNAVFVLTLSFHILCLLLVFPTIKDGEKCITILFIAPFLVLEILDLAVFSWSFMVVSCTDAVSPISSIYSLRPCFLVESAFMLPFFGLCPVCLHLYFACLQSNTYSSSPAFRSTVFSPPLSNPQ